jgi:3-oxoacyl-[acyl-carrier-protein] synthase III
VYQIDMKGGDHHGGEERLVLRDHGPAATREDRLPDTNPRPPARSGNDTVAIAQISTWVPEEAIEIEDLRQHLGMTPAQVKVLTRVHGLRQVRMCAQATLRAALLEVAEAALSSVEDRQRVHYVLHAHTLQDVAPSTVNVIHDVCRELGLGHATAFSVTQQNCASGLIALDIAGKLLHEDANGVALLLMGEKPFTPLAQLIPNTTVMGEATVACVLRPGGDRDQLVSYYSRTRGQYSAGLELDGRARSEFESEYTETLADVIRTAVRRAGLTLADVSLILPHNVNRSSWGRVARELEVAEDRLFLSNIARLGHCYCADPFLNLVAAEEEGLLFGGDHYVMAVVGLGATFAAAVFRH